MNSLFTQTFLALVLTIAVIYGLSLATPTMTLENYGSIQRVR